MQHHAAFELGFFAGVDRETAQMLRTVGVLDDDAPATQEFVDGLHTARGAWHDAG